MSRSLLAPLGAVSLALSFCTDARAFCLGYGDCDLGHDWADHRLHFLRPGVLDPISDEEYWQDFGGSEGVQEIHMQYCMLPQGSDYINREYNGAVAALTANPPRVFSAAGSFGRLLHPVQDFYAHANWVELIEQDEPGTYLHPGNVIDRGTGRFRSLDELSIVRDDIRVGSLPPGGLPEGWTTQMDLYSAIPTITVPGDGQYRGLVTGWDDSGICIDVREDGFVDDFFGEGMRTQRLRHGTNDDDDGTEGFYDPCEEDYPTYVCLNKDNDTRPYYEEALRLAGWQTEVEWCRLLHRTAAEDPTFNAASILMTLWADPDDSPHPWATECAPAAPGPVQVQVTIEDVFRAGHPSDNPAAFLVGAVYTGDFRQSSAIETTVEEQTLELCVDADDPVLATVWGWKDGAVGFVPGTFNEGDTPVRGTTLAIDPQLGDRVVTQEGEDIGVRFRVEIDHGDGDGDGLSPCAEAAAGTSDHDVDSDDDGLWDDSEAIFGTDPLRFDTDGDGLGDYHERAWYDTDPLDPDTDDDCLGDGIEVWYGTNPRQPDTDNDGRNDGDEVAAGTNPRVADSWRDLGPGDCDGGLVMSDESPDSDGDGLPDVFEDLVGLGIDADDSDKDGLRDGIDVDWALELVWGLRGADEEVARLLDEAAGFVDDGAYLEAAHDVGAARTLLLEAKGDDAAAFVAGALDRLAENLQDVGGAESEGGK